MVLGWPDSYDHISDEDDEGIYDNWKDALKAFGHARWKYNDDADVRLESRKYFTNEDGEEDYDPMDLDNTRIIYYKKRRK